MLNDLIEGPLNILKQKGISLILGDYRPLNYIFAGMAITNSPFACIALISSKFASFLKFEELKAILR